jgi:hypothetical protein
MRLNDYVCLRGAYDGVSDLQHKFLKTLEGEKARPQPPIGVT